MTMIAPLDLCRSVRNLGPEHVKKNCKWLWQPGHGSMIDKLRVRGTCVKAYRPRIVFTIRRRGVAGSSKTLLPGRAAFPSEIMLVTIAAAGGGDAFLQLDDLEAFLPRLLALLGGRWLFFFAWFHGESPSGAGLPHKGSGSRQRADRAPGVAVVGGG
jgi:hypothetical protein